jgi:hypothetical protein
MKENVTRPTLQVRALISYNLPSVNLRESYMRYQSTTLLPILVPEACQNCLDVKFCSRYLTLTQLTPDTSILHMLPINLQVFLGSNSRRLDFLAEALFILTNFPEDDLMRMSNRLVLKK